MEDKLAFSLSIDTSVKSNLYETAKWAKVLAIAGIVTLVALVVAGIFQITVLAQYTDSFGEGMEKVKVAIIISYLILLVIAFFPVMYMFRFAGKMKTALDANDQSAFNDAFNYLKIYFRYLGIITIIVLVLVILSFVFGIIGRATIV